MSEQATEQGIMRRYNVSGDGLERFLGPLEADVMRAIWALGSDPVSVKIVHRYMLRNTRDLAYTTAMTTMRRLWEKGVLTRKQQGLTYWYAPVDVDDLAFEARQVRAVLVSLGLREADVTPILDTLGLSEAA